MPIQLSCPYCKKAFPYSSGKIGKEYHENDQRLATIKQKLNALQTVRHTDETWQERTRLMGEEAKLHKRQSELRTIRDQAGEQTMRMEYQALKELIRDEYGDKELERLMNKVKEDLSSGGKKPLMYNGYSKAGYKVNAININRL